MRGGSEHQKEGGRRRVRVVCPRHRKHAAYVRLFRKLRFEQPHPAVCGVLRTVGAGVGEAALHDETGHNAMKRRAVIPAGLDEFQKVANVFRRQIGVHLDGDFAEIGFEQHLAAQFAQAGVFEGFELLRFNLDRGDFDRRLGQLIFVGFDERDFFDHLDAFVDLPEGGELPVELRLRIEADEKLRPAAVGASRDARR